MNVKFEFKSVEDRKRAYKAIREFILKDLVNGKIPMFHVFHIESDETVDNHYMTPISLEPVDEKGSRAVFVQDFEFSQKLLLRLKRLLRLSMTLADPLLYSRI